jgi:sulfotransferase family protein
VAEPKDRPPRSARPRILLIAGYLRTGSTLLERLLGQIDGITATGELRYVWTNGFQLNHLCGCGVPFRSCPFWRSVVDEAFGGFEGVDVDRLAHLQRSVDRLWHVPQIAIRRRLPRMERKLDEYLAPMELLYRAIQAVSGAEIIVDSSKAPSHGFLLRSVAGLDVDVVHLVRDSRAVAYSWRRLKMKPEVHWELGYMPRYGPARSAFEWSVMNLASHALGRRRGKYQRLRYEDLADQPRAVMTEVLVTLRYPDNGLEFLSGDMANLRPDHTVSGNPMRFETGPVRVAPDVAWEREMRRRDKRLVTAMTWPLLRAYGYGGDGPDRRS